ncbi:lipocalin family protein [Flavobacteriaceae bacterium 3-367]
MKKTFLATTAFLSALYISCDKGDDEVNKAPSAVTIEVAEEDLGNSINFTWKAATDSNGDKIIYDFYANTEIVGMGLTKPGYNWLFSEHKDTKFPISFKVTAKDGKGGTSESNIIERQDPVIGKWQLEQYITDGVDDTTDCDRQSILELKADGTYVVLYKYEPSSGTICDEETFTGTWENKGNDKYSFLSAEENEASESTITFEEGKMVVFFVSHEGTDKDTWARIN